MIEAAALKTLRDLANQLGNHTIPHEDVIDIAKAVVCLYESLDKRIAEIQYNSPQTNACGKLLERNK